MNKKVINNLSSPLSGSSHPLKGILYMVVAGLLLTANDGILKWLTDGYSSGQLMFVRGLFVFIPISFFIWWTGGIRQMQIASLKGQLFRAVFAVIGTFCFVTGLAYLPLAEAIAISFAGPLFVTAMASFFLKEIVGWRRWVAVFVGFIGVMVIIRPTGDAIQWAALLPLTASFMGALRDIITRHIAGGEQSATILTVSTAAVCLAGLATAPFGWQPVSQGDLFLFLVSGLLIGGAHFLMIESFRYAEAALVTPFKYTSIIWGITVGFLVWGDLPDQWTITGSIIVIASGIYILSRETKKAQDHQVHS
jgi:drug/metabolite transporter (DMT)-like permease